jgi:creatinine amidohydrolase
LLTLGLPGYTLSGIIGRPSAATTEKGKLVLDALVERAASHVHLLA